MDSRHQPTRHDPLYAGFLAQLREVILETLERVVDDGGPVSIHPLELTIEIMHAIERMDADQE